MAGSTYTLLFSEVLDEVHKAKTKDQKVKILRRHNTEAFRIVLKSSFDPKIEWAVPEGKAPYVPNDAPAGTEHTVLAAQASKLWHYIKGADRVTTQPRKEQMFIQLLEGLHSTEAELLCDAKDKKLHQVYKGLSTNVVKEAFGWNDDFVISDPSDRPYITTGRSASGLVDDPI